jgi:cellulose synthase/poly-beta-1,6-N-acetylglucosamine synthase-like glycosyltransferase
VIDAYVKKDSRFRTVESGPAEGRLTAKKHALLRGIQSSRGEIILSTDADCRVLPTWIETLVSYFEADVGMVVGFSQLDVPGSRMTLLEKLQALDFLALMTAARGALNLGHPLAASGQNLAYRRLAFDEVGGFHSIGHRISGDDVLLLQLVRMTTSWKIRFAPSAAGYNTSRPEKSLSALLNQRRRWASNGAYQRKLNRGFFLYVLNTFALNCMVLGYGVTLLFQHNPSAWITCVSIKFAAEGLIAAAGCFATRRGSLLKVFPFWACLQIPYVIFVGLFGSIGSIDWKSRRHSGPAE